MTDTTAPRTAAPDPARLRRLHQVTTEYVYADTGYRAAEPGPETRAIDVCSCDLGSCCPVPSLLSAIEPLLALVRAAGVLAECIGIDDYYETVSWPVDNDGNSSSDEADRAAHVFAETLRALPESVRVAARKPEPFDEADNMCPNCVTPWKCNGPHLAEETVAARKR